MCTQVPPREAKAASDKGKAAVGTVSGTSISFGTPVEFEAGGTTLFFPPAADPD